MDKKSCENCLMQTECKRCPSRKGCTSFSLTRWQRNPRKWLSILPEEPAYYFYRKDANKWRVGEVLVKEGKLFWKSNNHEVNGTYEWQGPITPED
jgi:hypothetical protein